MGGSEVFLFVLRVGEQQENNASRNVPLVDNAHPAAFAASRSRPAELAQAAGTKDEIAAFGIRHERPLQGVQFLIGQEFACLPGEE